MKPFHDSPVAAARRGAERSLPPGGGLLIAVGISVLIWILLLWMLFD
jgi:hypothetical protein